MATKMNTIDWSGNRLLVRDIEVAGSSLYTKPKGRYSWYVDAKRGSNNNDGRTWDSAKATMSSVFTASDFGSGDVIYLKGKLREQVETPDGVFDVTVVGAGNMPRHADDHTESGNDRGSSAATWTAPASGSTANPLIRVNQQGWAFYDLVFQLSGSATACVESFKNAESGDDEKDGGHLLLQNCRLVSDTGTPAGIGFHRDGGNGYCYVIGCFFQGFADAIGHTAGDGGGDGYHYIVGNRFSNNTDGIDSPLFQSLVKGNYFLDGHTKEIDLTGGSNNIVTENVFMDDYDVNVAGTGDLWFNNYSLDTDSAEVDADGKTSAVPA